MRHSFSDEQAKCPKPNTGPSASHDRVPISRFFLASRTDHAYLSRAAPYPAAMHLRELYMSDTPILPPLLVDLPKTRRLLSAGKTKLNDLCNAGDLHRQHIGHKVVITWRPPWPDRLKKKG